MEDHEPAQLRISSPAEVAQLIPYLVGFTPQDSLVIVVIQSGRVQVTARADLPDVMPGGAAEDLLNRIWTRFPDSDAHAVAYTSDHQAAWKLLARCDAWLPYGCLAMIVDGDIWHLRDGTTGTLDRSGQIGAQASSYGLQRLESRAELEARFASAPDSAELDRHLGAALASLPRPGQVSQIVALTCKLLDEHLPGVSDGAVSMTATSAIRLSVLAQHPVARDVALLSMNHDNAADHLRLWQRVIGASPAYGAEMSLCLAGMAAWISGDGASANVALERVLKADPEPADLHLARFLDDLIENVVPPSAWNDLRGSILSHVDPVVSAALRRPAPGSAPRREPPPATERTPDRAHEQARRRPPTPGIAI